MARKSKGVVVGQVFIYIIAVIVFALVLIFGYQAITGFLEKGEKVAYLTFKTDLENAIKNVYSDFGTVAIYSGKNVLAVPVDYEEICFVDLDKPVTINITFCNENPIICDSWRTAYGSGVTKGTSGWQEGDQNVFLKPIGLSPIKVYKITVDTDEDGEEELSDDGYLCLPVIQGKLFMRVEGMGDHTFVSNASISI
ncbi:hypothetical protein KY306_02865 [Candidatus Woesearchaeota archaeon]|nr:hypothetical protein [Candidatus Woesearchaeota archaeon]